MQEPYSENVPKKASTEIYFSEYGRNFPDDESLFKEPTTENKRVIDLYDPVDAMSLNRERDRVVVSGIRGVLQIIKIQNSKNSNVEKPAIIKDLDMRVYRKGKVNILYSAQNVKWNQLYDQYIATTSSNGSIVCWNVSRKNKSVFKSHERSATCLDWHATTPYLLISGSRDCTVKSYDMRVKDSHQLEFTDRNCESIRDVAMCKAPGFDDYFFTGDDGGVLRVWDLRQTKRWVFQKVAHRSFVSTLALNPHNRTMIATGGGRDKMVKIWDWTGPELNRISVVETTAPLGRVVWRPDKPFHLATCASVNETTVHVWDVRRPYLPYVTYDEHRDSVTDACWPSNDTDVFLTCGKDGTVVLHNIDSGHAPISYACDVSFDITPDGTMGLAINSEIHAKNDAELEASLQKSKPNTKAPGKKKSLRSIPYETFNKPIKSLVAFGVPEALTHSLPPTTFYKIAEKYVIGGTEITQLCEKNSKTARKAGLEHVAQTWKLVEALCEQAKIQEEYTRLSIEEKSRIIRAWAIRKKELAEEGRRWIANLNELYRADVKRQVTQRLESTQHVTAFLKFSSSEESEEDNDQDPDNQREDVDRMAPNYALKRKRRKKKKNAVASDFFFGAGEANFKGGKEESLHYNEFIGLRNEAYELRDVEGEKKFFCKARKQPTTTAEYELLKKEFEENESDFQAWSPMIEIYRLLLYHAEQGDMQTCATITMVCGKRLLDAVDFYTTNGWITCYMEMLDSLELYTVIAKIRKYCTLESINAVSRENTLIQQAHADCDALIQNGRCAKCEEPAQPDCTICRYPIVGMTYQCNVCGHCMHVDHAYEWFRNSTSCAFVGCPCTCGDNMWPDIERTFIGNDEVIRKHRKFEYVEPSEEPTSYRVDASRLDTDSEESQPEDLEWSPGTEQLKEKFGEIACKDWNTPWAKYLVQLHKTRTEKRPEEEESGSDGSDETKDDDPRVLSPITQKEWDQSCIRGAFMYDMQEQFTIKRKIMHLNSDLEDEEEKRPKNVDRADLVYHYLNSDEEEEECKVEEEDSTPTRRRLELIIEEDESCDDIESQFELGRFPDPARDRLERKEKKLFDHLIKVRSLNGNKYIKSIRPIGNLGSDEESQYLERLPENERSASPTLSSAVRGFLKNVKRETFGYSSDSSEYDENGEDIEVSRQPIDPPTEKEGHVRKAKKVLYAKKALKILAMTKDELKQRKKIKDKKRINKVYEKMFPHDEANQVSDVSADEFLVSSSSPSSSSSFMPSPLQSAPSSPSPSVTSESTEISTGSSVSELFVPESESVALNINEGYKAESEGCSSDSLGELSVQPAVRYPTPAATGDLYVKSESPAPKVIHRFRKFKKKRPAKYSESSDSEELFSSNEEIPVPSSSALKEEADDIEPFFPTCEDIPLESRGRHPWETEKQYQHRLKKEKEEEAEELAEKEEIRRAEEEALRKAEEEARELLLRLSKHTPVMRELARRRRRAMLKMKMPPCPKPFANPLPPLKRVRYSEKDFDNNMKIALKNLKEDTGISDDSDYQQFVTEQAACPSCQKRACHERQEKEYVQWMKNVADENQIFFAKSLSDSCSVFQLSHLDSYTTDIERAKRTALHLTEFIKMFYFIKWDDLLLPYNELLLKEVYELWQEFHKKRPRVCRLHYRDYQFRFFASSIATKIKQELLRDEAPSVTQRLLSYDWLHMKACVNTLDDDPNAMDEMLDTVVSHNPNWSIEEKKAANRYWDMFGDVPLHMETTDSIVVPPASEDKLEIIDETNHLTKKMIMNAAYNARKFDIRLTYTTRKKHPDLFFVQEKSQKVLNREWQMRLDKMINETRHVDLSTSTFRVNPHDKLIYTADAKHPWPVCQFDMGDRYVTVQPIISKRYQDLKSRLRRKFQFRRGTKCHKVSKHVEITTDELRKLPSFKRFEPKLQKAKDLQDMLSKHFKVVDRTIVNYHHKLFPIVEEGEEVGVVLKLLKNKVYKPGDYYIDSEDIFAIQRWITDGNEEEEAYDEMVDDEYRKQLGNFEKQEAEKMKIINKRWMPEFRKKLRLARKVIEIGRLMAEEDVRKWMEYQYELSFARKQYRKNSWITRKELMKNVPPKWHEAIENMDFDGAAPPPIYAMPLPPPAVKARGWNDGKYNSSSDSEEYDSDDTKPDDDEFIQYEIQPDLQAVAGRLQVEIIEKVELDDELADEEWEYSDDSSVSTWFDNDTDDIMNRLLNADYVEEKMILKERLKGPLAKKLWEIAHDRTSPEPVADEEENTSFDLMVNREREEKENQEIAWKEENLELNDIGDSDGKRRKELSKEEHDLFVERHSKREDREEEIQQIRLFFKQFRLDHSYTSEPYNWSNELRDGICGLHKNELRRVANRLHTEIKEEYENTADQENVIAEIIPSDEYGLQYKLINFLLFRKGEESFEESVEKVERSTKALKPLQRYEMFFGREGAYKIKEVAREVLNVRCLHDSFSYLMRHFGTDWEFPPESANRFIRLWYSNSRDTLQNFLTNADSRLDTRKLIRDTSCRLNYSVENVEHIRDTFDTLEIAGIVNEMVHDVHEYVEETTLLFENAQTERDRQGFATMDFLYYYEMKKGVPRSQFMAPTIEKDYLVHYASSGSSSPLSEEIDTPPIRTTAFEVEIEKEEEEEEEKTPTPPPPPPPRSKELYISPNRFYPISEKRNCNAQEAETFSKRRGSVKEGKPNKKMMKRYSQIYKNLKAQEVEKRRRNDEELAKQTLLRWQRVEREQRWMVEDMERKVHDFLMMHEAAYERKGEKNNNFGVMLYDKKDMHTTEVLEMCGLPLSLDHQMFSCEFEECQSAATSISDASEFAEAIEKGFKDIDDDAQSYSSVKHVMKHELHFQTEVESRRVPSCVVVFAHNQFFEDPHDLDWEFKKWSKVIEASESPFSFNRLVMRERILQRCRDAFRTEIIEKYLDHGEKHYHGLMEIFARCCILVVLDTNLVPWDCRITSPDDLSGPPSDRVSYLRKRMVEDSQEHLSHWLETNKIDMEVYASCPVIVASNKNLTWNDGALISTIYMEEHIQEDWLMIRRDEGVRALDAIIRMPPPPASKLGAYKLIFKPIYDAWFDVWQFENKRNHGRTMVIRKVDIAKEYIHKAKMIVNYAHQHYRMKRFDSFMSKDPTEYQMVDKADVPSASLFDSLEAAVNKFCDEDSLSEHLDNAGKQSVKDTLIQLATGKIPYFTANYFGGYDYSENVEINADDEENDDDRMPLGHTNVRLTQPTTSQTGPQEMEDCEEEYKWLRGMYEETDFQRKRFMAVILFEIAQKAIFEYAPNMADFERAQNRFEHLLTLHGRQRPLLDMMLTKVRGTYFMDIDTNLFLYDQKLITFGELVDSELHPKEWQDRRTTLEEFRRQEPSDPDAMEEFFNLGKDSESDSENNSDSSSSLSSSSGSSTSSKRGRRAARKSLNKVRRELMLTKMRSKPVNPDETFAKEKRALGPKGWKLRRQISEMVECIADLDRTKLEEKWPAKKKDLLKYIGHLIVNNCDSAHWSWGELKMKTKVGKIPPVSLMRPKHVNRIRKGMTKNKPPKKYDPKDPRTSGRKWF